MLFGAKQPCRAHVIATMPEISHAFEKSKAFSIALKFVLQGAFFVKYMSPARHYVIFDTQCVAPSGFQK